MPDNALYYGDNLDILRRYIPDESVDLVYLDPPFNSKATYNVLFDERNGSASDAQIMAFEDSWHWDDAARDAVRETRQRGPKKAADMLEALRDTLGQNDVTAYLAMMTPRLVELHRVLKPTGTVYLHCDPTASHYLKIIMDSIFGPANFLNEVVWQRSTAHNMRTRGFVRVNDTILVFAKSGRAVFNEQRIGYGEAQLKRYRPDADGRLYKGENLTFSTPNPHRQFEWRGSKPPPNRSWGASLEQLEQWYAEGRILLKRDGTPRLDGLKVYLDETKGYLVTTNWTDIPRIGNTSGERLGYPTQKPEPLLRRIIEASSNEGDLVLDPFCGCGTAVAVAELLHRRWIGVDITHLAIRLVRMRLRDTFKDALSPYEVIGEPQDVESARALAEESESGRHLFESWALDLVGAQPASGKPKKGADKGVDGYVYFEDDDSGKSKKVIVQVKSGHVGAPVVQQLRGAMEDEHAQIGALLTLQPPTGPMHQAALAAPDYDPPGLLPPVPSVQILTIEGLLNGTERLQYPDIKPTTFRRAPRQHKPKRQTGRSADPTGA